MKKYNVCIYADEILMGSLEIYRIGINLFRVFKAEEEVLLGRSWECREYIDKWVERMIECLNVYREFNNLQFSINVVDEF